MKWMQTLDSFLRWWGEEENAGLPRPTVLPEGFLAPISREALLSDSRIQSKLVTLKRSGIGLPYELWDTYVIDTVVSLASYVQALPASQYHHHAYPQGLLLHSLDTAIYALRVRRNYTLPPNVEPEDRIFREIIWVYGVFLTALLHDVGKLFDFEIQLLGENDQPMTWDYTTPITTPYRYRYFDDRQYETHQTLAGSLLSRVISAEPMRALTHDRFLWATMAACLTGQPQDDNVVADIVSQADAASVAQDLGAEGEAISEAAEQAAAGYTRSLSGQLRTTLKYLLGSGKLPLNRKGAEGFVFGDHVYLVCKPIADTLRAQLMERGIRNVPSNNSKLFNELQQSGLVVSGDDGQAIFRCDIHLSDSDWTQTLTCLKVAWPSLLPDAHLVPLTGQITELPPALEEQNDVTAPSMANVEGVSSESDPERTPIALPVSLGEAPTGVASSMDDELMQLAMGLATPSVANLETNRPSLDEHHQPVTPSLKASILLRTLSLTDASDDQLTDAFLEWVDAVICGGVHKTNTQGALFHRVGDYLAVSSPNVFRTFLKERTAGGDYEQRYPGIQRTLGQKVVLKPQSTGQTIHRIGVKGGDKPLNMMLWPLSDKLRARLSVNPALEWSNDE
ncbi:MobH family relaxase [Vibrio pectenicida]